jgi:50S ribosomal subunit-associated GTPase HflX
MDLPQAKKNLRDFEKHFPQRMIMPISAKERRGINELKRLLGEWIDQEQQAVAGQAGVGAGYD